jgi:formate-dependent nitrite reductase cytochrome c552 subunit
VGTTDKSGNWESSEIRPGKKALKVVAKGYTERAIEKNLDPGQKEVINISLAPEKPAVVLDSATVMGIKSIAVPHATHPAVHNRNSSLENIVDNVGAKPTTAATAENSTVLICPNCHKEYILTPGSRKPRFCTNCGKPFR